MLYEMVAGRPPFLGDDNIAIIGQHINTQAVAPTWHRSDCPRPLEAIIMRLLAKDPAERPDSAADVLTALESINLSDAVSVEQSVDQTHVLDSLAGDVFVGRQAEMDQLKAALEDALSGKGRMVTLVGEPGIGKTRTAQELATYAGLRGCQVLWGRCYEEQGVPPYWPWVQAIRSYVRDAEPDQLRSEMGSGAADIAEIVSDVKTQLPDLEAPTQLDSPEQARFRLFDSIAAFLKTASLRKPIVLMLDDLHWSDKPSLMFLEFLVRELSGARLLIVGTYRDVELSRQHPLAETLGELTRQRLFERVLLRGLSYDDVARFIEVSSGITPPVTLASAVHTQTEGNPLFVTEVVRLLVQEGELTQERVRDRDSWEIRVPEGVREVIGRRLNRLSQRCNETLTMAAVVGREFTLTQLDRLIDDQTQDMVLDVLEEALTARLIEELPTSVGLYQFTHALMQETLVDELSLTRRVRLHARIAETLEKLYGDDADSHAAELAHHFAQAEAVLGTDKLVQWSRVAGNRAIDNYAFEDAIAHLETALSANGGPATDNEEAQARFGLGQAQCALGNYEIAWANLNIAFNYFEESKDVPSAISVALFFIRPAMRLPGTADMISRALELAPPESRESGRLLSRHGYVLGTNEGDYEGAKSAFERALVIAHRENDGQSEQGILNGLVALEANYVRWQESVEYLTRSAELAAQTFYLEESTMGGQTWGVIAHISLGNLQAARVQTKVLTDRAERSGLPERALLAIFARSTMLYVEGDWDAIRGLQSDTGSARVSTIALHLIIWGLMEYQTGNLAQADVHWQEILSSDSYLPSRATVVDGIWALSLAIASHITGTEDHRTAARSASETILSSKNASPVIVNFAHAAMAIIAVQQGDTEAAKDLYSALKPLRGTMSGCGLVSSDRILGMLAQTMGNHDDSQTHFEDALAFCRKAGYRPELAWSLSDYADMLTERSEDGDSDKATAMLDESLAISTELGMRPLMERVLSRREILKA